MKKNTFGITIHLTIALGFVMKSDSLGEVSLLNGAAQMSITTPAEVSLTYRPDAAFRARATNFLAPTGVCGLGWRFEFPAITVDHKNTVRIDDDKWFYHDGNGGGSEIVRLEDASAPDVGSFVLKSNPLMDVAVETVTEGELVKIVGWTLTSPDGSKMVFGKSGASQDALRHVPSFPSGWDSRIGEDQGRRIWYDDENELPPVPEPNEFYYRWDIKERITVHGSKTVYFHERLTSNTLQGYSYTAEAYVEKIVSPIEDTTFLYYGTKRAEELAELPSLEPFDFQETKYLKRIHVKNRYGSELNNVQFDYSVPGGDFPPLHDGVLGMEKRLLHKVTMSKPAEARYVFSYSDDGTAKGCLKSAWKPLPDRKITYGYGSRYAGSNLHTYYPWIVPENINDLEILVGRDAAFLSHSPEDDEPRVRGFARISSRWHTLQIPGLTDGRLPPTTRFFAGGDWVSRLSVDKKVEEEMIWKVWKRIENSWKLVLDERYTSDSRYPIDKCNVFFGTEYAALYTPGDNKPRVEIVSWDGNDYVKTVDNWVHENHSNQSTLPYHVASGGPDYIVHCFKTLTGNQNYHARILEQDNGAWTGKSMPVNYRYSDEEVILTCLPDYFSLTQSEHAGSADRTDFAMVRRRPESGDWLIDEFGEEAIMEFSEHLLWPREAEMIWRENCLVVVEAKLETEKGARLKLYRYQYEPENERYNWRNTYINSVPKVKGELFGKESYYALDLEHPLVGIRVTDRTVLVATYEGEKQYRVTAYRWEHNGVSGDDSQKQWTVVGNKVVEEVVAVHLGETFMGAQDGHGGIHTWNADPSAEGGYNYLYSHYTHGYNADEKTKWTITDNMSVLVTCDPYAQVFVGNEHPAHVFVNIDQPVVGKVTYGGASDAKLEKSYHFEDMTYDIHSGNPVFAAATEEVGTGAGKTVYEFRTDSSSGLFGQNLSTRHFSDDESISNTSETEIRISGLFYELDRRTPLTGYVGIGKGYDVPTEATTQAIDPNTGEFRVAADYGVEKQSFTFYYFPRIDDEDPEQVFRVGFRENTGTPYVYYHNHHDEEVEKLLYESDGYNWEQIVLNGGMGVSTFVLDWSGLPVSGTETYSLPIVTSKIQALNDWTNTYMPRRVVNWNMRDGVLERTLLPFEHYDDKTNTPLVVANPLGDKYRIHMKKPAYEVYPDMANAGMYSQTAGSSVFGSADIENPGGDLSECVSAAATTWDNTLSNNGVWYPANNYVWKATLGPDNKPMRDFEEFDYNEPTGAGNADNGWVWSGGVRRYNEFGRPLESMSPGSSGSDTLFNSSIYRHDFYLQTAAVKNARYGECGALTGDYETPGPIIYTQDYQPTGLDAKNGWEYGVKSGVTSSSVSVVTPTGGEKPFWGERYIKVTHAFGPTRNFKLQAGRDYILSAWVKVKPGQESAWLHADYRRLDEKDDGDFPYMLKGPFDATDEANYRKVTGSPAKIAAPSSENDAKWVYKELFIPASEDLGVEDEWYARVHVGMPEGGTALVQDIRFYPADAMVTTSYYSQTQRQQILAINVNGKPGRKVTHDYYGRPVKWEKADLDGNSFNGWVTLREKEYQFAGLSEIYANHFEPSDPQFFIKIRC